MILAEPVIDQLVSRLARPDRRADQRRHGEERAADPSQPPRLRGDDPAAEHWADDAGYALDRGHGAEDAAAAIGRGGMRDDRKSTRLNSSHLGISYAVFCLKKKKAILSRDSPAKNNKQKTRAI